MCGIGPLRSCPMRLPMSRRRTCVWGAREREIQKIRHNSPQFARFCRCSSLPRVVPCVISAQSRFDPRVVVGGWRVVATCCEWQVATTQLARFVAAESNEVSRDAGCRYCQPHSTGCSRRRCSRQKASRPPRSWLSRPQSPAQRRSCPWAHTCCVHPWRESRGATYHMMASGLAAQFA